VDVGAQWIRTEESDHSIPIEAPARGPVEPIPDVPNFIEPDRRMRSISSDGPKFRRKAGRLGQLQSADPKTYRSDEIPAI